MTDFATLDLDFTTGQYRVIPYIANLKATPSLLPPNTTPLERAIEQTQAVFDPAIKVPGLWNADTCPASALPYLAWALSVDEWDHTWSEDRKRAVIRESREIHQRKGTPSAIRRALAAMGQPDAEIIERADYIKHNGAARRNGQHRRLGHGGWATFRVVLKRAVTIDQAIQIRRVLDAVKRNCIELVAIDYSQAALRHNGQTKRNGLYTRGTVSAQLN